MNVSVLAKSWKCQALCFWSKCTEMLARAELEDCPAGENILLPRLAGFRLGCEIGAASAAVVGDDCCGDEAFGPSLCST